MPEPTNADLAETVRRHIGNCDYIGSWADAPEEPTTASALAALAELEARAEKAEAALRGMVDLYGRQAAEESNVYAVQQALAALTQENSDGR